MTVSRNEVFILVQIGNDDWSEGGHPQYSRGSNHLQPISTPLDYFIVKLKAAQLEEKI